MPNMKRSSTAFVDAVDDACFRKQCGENGMPEFSNRGLGSNVLALSQLVRGGDTQSLVDDIMSNGSTSDIADMIVLLFASRNCRGGKGEKKIAYDMFVRLYKEYPATAKDLLKLFPHFGYWKDLLLIAAQAKSDPMITYDSDLLRASIIIMKDQLLKDMAALEKYRQDLKETFDEDQINKLERAGPGISLLAKWLPRESSSLDRKLGFVKIFSAELFPYAKTADSTSWESAAKASYRKVVAELTSFLELPEVLLSAHKEEEIYFGKLASKATLCLTKTFMNEDKYGNIRSENPKRIRLAERFTKHIVDKKGLKGGQLMPHEIVSKILNSHNMSNIEELALDAQWKDLWKTVVEQAKAKAAEDGAGDISPTRMVPLCDVSGSMYGQPIEVAIALSLGISEITHEAFRNRVLTFESQPQWHQLNPDDTIAQKVKSLRAARWGYSTNFEAAYDLVLDVVEKSCLSKEDIPSLIVFSDMQFNQAAGYGNSSYSCVETMHDVIIGKVARVGKRLGWDDCEPTPMVYWNLRNTGGHPVDKDTEGAVLLAGFSPALLKLVMYGEALREEEVELVQADGSVVIKKIRVTPEEILRRMLNDKIYDPVREVLVSSQEKKLVEYEFSTM